MFSRRGLIRVATAAAASAALMLGGASTASADPPQVLTVELTCDNGQTYQVLVPGGGEFTPGLVANSTSVLVPTRFGSLHVVVTDAEGNVIDESTDPPSAKGSSTKPRATSVSCTFSFEETFVDPVLGELTIRGEGSVEGFVTPVRM